MAFGVERAQPLAHRHLRQRARRRGQGPGVGRVELRRQRPAAGRRRPRRCAAWRHSSGTGSRPERSARRGSSSWRTRLRRWRRSRLDGSSSTSRPSWSHRARVSARRSASSGRRGPGRMPARPSRAAPRSRLSSTVSAWSSAVCPVSHVGRQHRVAGGAGPGLEVPARRHVHGTGPEAGAEAGGERSDPGRLPPARPDRSPWSTWTASTRHPAATASTSSAEESAPPDTAQVISVPAAGNVARASSERTSSVASARPRRRISGRRASRWGAPVRSSVSAHGPPPAWAATRDPPRPGRAAPCRPPPRRRR